MVDSREKPECFPMLKGEGDFKPQNAPETCLLSMARRLTEALARIAPEVCTKCDMRADCDIYRKLKSEGVIRDT